MFFSTYMLMMATHTWLIYLLPFCSSYGSSSSIYHLCHPARHSLHPVSQKDSLENSFFAFWYSASNFPSASPQNSPQDKLLFLRTLKSYPINNNSNNKNTRRCQSTEKHHSDHIFHYYREHFLLLIKKSPE